jgi:hypothetical protein
MLTEDFSHFKTHMHSVIFLFDYFKELTLLLFNRLHLVYMYLETGRGKEARDAARASLGQPAWTVGKDQSVSTWGQEMSFLFLIFLLIDCLLSQYNLTIDHFLLLTVLPSLLLDVSNIAGPRSFSDSSRVYRDCYPRRDARIQSEGP